MSESYGIFANNILGLHTNAPDFRWMFGGNPPPASRDSYARCAVGIRFLVGSGVRGQDAQRREDERPLETYQHFRGARGGDSVTYGRNLFVADALQLRVEALLTGNPEIFVNSAYYHLVKCNIQNLHACQTIIADIACLLLLKHRFSPVYCAAFKHGKMTALVFSPPNVGKSLCVARLCADSNTAFIAEDIAITDGEQVYAVPWTASLRHNPDKDSRVRRLVFERMPFLDLLQTARCGYDRARNHNAKICDQAEITHLIFLKSGAADGLKKLNRSQALQKINNLNRFMFRYDKSPLLSAYEYFNSELDLEGLRSTEKTILADLVDNAMECLEITAPTPARFAQILSERFNFQHG